MQTSTIVLYRTVFDSVGGFDDIIQFKRGRRVQAEDYDFTLKLSYRHPFIASRQATVKYRAHPDQSRILVADQLAVNFQYRIRFLNSMTKSELETPRLAEGVRRMKVRWQLSLEGFWGRKAMAELRQLVWFGIRQPWLRNEPVPYLFRSLVPFLRN